MPGIPAALCHSRQVTQYEQEEEAVRIAYDAVANLYADHFPSTEPEQPT